MFILYVIDYYPWIHDDLKICLDAWSHGMDKGCCGDDGELVVCNRSVLWDPIILASMNLAIDPVFAILFFLLFYPKFKESIYLGTWRNIGWRKFTFYIIVVVSFALIDTWLYFLLGQFEWNPLSTDQEEKVSFLRNFSEASISMILFTGIWYMYSSNLSLEISKERLKVDKERLSRRGVPHDFENIFAYLGSFHSMKAKKFSERIRKYATYLIYERVRDNISLKTEIDHLENYFYLRSRKISESVSYLSFNKPEQFDDTLQIVPGILVEGIRNSIKHCEKDESNSFIEVTITIHKNVIKYKVKNLITRNGVPQKKTQGFSSGRGLAYTRKCLSTYYPEKHQFIDRPEGQVYLFFIELQL